jgi:hypothetical protein
MNTSAKSSLILRRSRCKRISGHYGIGVILSLGDREEVAAVPTLQKLATDSNDDAANVALSSHD